jgi:hypothetical protein
MPKPVDTSIEDLLRSGGTPEDAIEQLTPKARNLTKGHLVALWLDHDDDVKRAGVGKGRLKSPQLSTEDINSILTAFKAGEGRGRPEARSYYADRYAVIGISPLSPEAWFDNWSCCCCTPCCCCAAAQTQNEAFA